ncbi:MAG: helix-turn-helix transcriptional regulator [Anaerolineaceae bacterium]|nr:helix-turn-helix transcriptional regulator [Anaerolineaceae bacterium]
MVTETFNNQLYEECINDVDQYIHNNISQPLNRELLAAVAGFSVPHFHRIFTAQKGENVAAYVRRIRLERAGWKLRMGAVDITEVALAAGYESHAAFSKAFKQQFGFSPSEFRELACHQATQVIKNARSNGTARQD